MSPSKEVKKIRIHPDEFPMAEHLFREAVGEYLKAEDEYTILDDMSKDVLASIMTKYEKLNDGEKISETKLERLARVDPEWKTYKEGLYEARRNRGVAKARLMKAEKYWATLQSALAYKRDEMAYMRSGA